MHVAALAPGLLFSATLTTFARAAQPPAWDLSTDWGVSSDAPDNDHSYYDTRKAGGVTLRLNKQWSRSAIYIEGGAFPIWASYYSGRAGGIFGLSLSEQYGEMADRYRVGSETITTSRVYTGRNIDTILGVGGDLAVYAAADGSGVIIEGGAALLGQMLVELYAAYDLTHSTPGGRLNFIYRVGDTTFDIGFKINPFAVGRLLRPPVTGPGDGGARIRPRL